jgi:hypothetical protein
MASSLDLDRMPGGDISKEEFQEMVFVDSPSAIAELLFDLAEQIGIIQECVKKSKRRSILILTSQKICSAMYL